MTTDAVLPAPSLEYGQLAPMLIVFAVAVVGVLVEAFAPRRVRYPAHVGLTLGGLAAAFVTVVALAGTRNAAAVGSVAIDGPALFLQGTILLVSFLAMLLFADRGLDRAAVPEEQVSAGAHGVDAFAPRASAVPGSDAEEEAAKAGAAQTEVFPLALLAVGGMLLFPAANDLLTMFVALEVLSLPLYLLCGLARRRRLLSQEAALKYFLLGAFSSAFFLFGVAMLYGFAGTVSLPGIGRAVEQGTGDVTLARIGLALLAVGLLFKIGAVPFHSWIPDVYQGAPTPVTAFMASATKIAAFGATLRVFSVAVPGLAVDWRPVLWAVAILTMLGGAVLAITQSDIKRMLAYSSVAHAGFILTGVVADNAAGISSTLFYLLAYGFSTLGAFAVVGLVRDGAGAEVTDLSRWAGLGRSSPAVATVFALFLLSFAGIPLTSGFVGKFAVFQAAASGGAVPLVIVGVVASAVAAVFYVRVIVLLFFSDAPPGAPVVVVSSGPTVAAVVTTAAVTVVLGIAPQPVLDLADRAASFLT
ncbi:NADH-quinone oxidoreductase subunit NuoN [Rhodococcus sp. SGAir0479]|uniref:NADH-quinone oxidoreductase subunit NuoN n=1 Tax=Rhodococcus sp. SGAir0479 TaxID=2567884 RepID=UPI0010CD64AC|nr:NADH-quinone oxidoreductase subunit NuoN [Rhodococcus sp. SGAir0479]QCQ90718.1 NADH-quinone oxidoreductase subunit NuoN [Rhodococcus sp. SGAir0479]